VLVLIDDIHISPNNWPGNQHQLWYVITTVVPNVTDTVTILNNGTFSAMAAMSSISSLPDSLCVVPDRTNNNTLDPGQAPVTGQTDLLIPDFRALWKREPTTTTGAYR